MEASDGQFRFLEGTEVRHMQSRVDELLRRLRALLSSCSSAWGIAIANSSSVRRRYLESLYSDQDKRDVSWLQKVSIDDVVIRVGELALGLDYVCDSYNDDGRVLSLEARLRAMLLGAHVQLINLTAVVSASDTDLEAMMLELHADLVDGTLSDSKSGTTQSSDSVISSSSSTEQEPIASVCHITQSI